MSGELAELDRQTSDIPESWDIVALSDCLADFRNGWTYDTRALDGTMPITRIETISNGVIDYGRIGFAQPDDRIEAFKLDRNDILFSHINSVEHIAKVAIKVDNRPLYHGMNLMRLRPNERVVPDFLFARLQSEQTRDHFRSVCKRAVNQASLNKGEIGSYKFLLPPLDEQRRIAEVLRSVDEAIAANEAALKQRDRVRKGFSSLFHSGLGHSEFQSSCIGEIPASWQVGTMKDVCHNVGVGIASSATHAYVEQGIPLLRNQNIKPGHLDLDDLLFVNEDYDRSYASKRVRTGDIITMRTGYPGRSAVIPPELDGCQTFTTLISRPNVAVVDPLFLCEWINSEPGMNEIRKRQAGGAQQNLNAGAMEQVPVPLPPMEEQRQIASILRNFPTEDDALIAKLRTVRKLMQADLLSGRLRVPA